MEDIENQYQMNNNKFIIIILFHQFKKFIFFVITRTRCVKQLKRDIANHDFKISKNEFVKYFLPALSKKGLCLRGNISSIHNILIILPNGNNKCRKLLTTNRSNTTAK